MKKFRRIIDFILKLLILAVLLVAQYYYHWFENVLGIPVKFIDAILIYLIANVMISISRILIIFIYLRRKKLSPGTRDNFVIGIDQIATILSIVFLVFAFLTLFNLDFRSVFTSLSIVAAAVALLSKDYISNMINGMIIMFSDELSISDYIKVGNHKGRITNITLINIHLVNEDGDLVYIPNNSIFTNNVINYSKGEENIISVEFDLDFNQSTKLDELNQFLVNSLAAWKDKIINESFKIKVVDLDKNTALVKFQFKVTDTGYEFTRSIRQYIRKMVIEFFSKIR